MSDPILQLSTQLDPPKTFTVDGEEYHLLGLEHLSSEKEAEATGAFARFDRIMGAMSGAKNDADARKYAIQLRHRRVKLLSLLTDMPEDVATKLPLSAQIDLLEAVQRETGQGADDDFDDVPDADGSELDEV